MLSSDDRCSSTFCEYTPSFVLFKSAVWMCLFWYSSYFTDGSFCGKCACVIKSTQEVGSPLPPPNPSNLLLSLCKVKLRKQQNGVWVMIHSRSRKKKKKSFWGCVLFAHTVASVHRASLVNRPALQAVQTHQ